MDAWWMFERARCWNEGEGESWANLYIFGALTDWLTDSLNSQVLTRQTFNCLHACLLLKVKYELWFVCIRFIVTQSYDETSFRHDDESALLHAFVIAHVSHVERRQTEKDKHLDHLNAARPSNIGWTRKALNATYLLALYNFLQLEVMISNNNDRIKQNKLRKQWIWWSQSIPLSRVRMLVFSGWLCSIWTRSKESISLISVTLQKQWMNEWMNE